MFIVTTYIRSHVVGVQMKNVVVNDIVYLKFTLERTLLSTKKWACLVQSIEI